MTSNVNYIAGLSVNSCNLQNVVIGQQNIGSTKLDIQTETTKERNYTDVLKENIVSVPEEPAFINKKETGKYYIKHAQLMEKLLESDKKFYKSWGENIKVGLALCDKILELVDVIFPEPDVDRNINYGEKHLKDDLLVNNYQVRLNIDNKESLSVTGSFYNETEHYNYNGLYKASCTLNVSVGIEQYRKNQTDLNSNHKKTSLLDTLEKTKNHTAKIMAKIEDILNGIDFSIKNEKARQIKHEVDVLTKLQRESSRELLRRIEEKRQSEKEYENSVKSLCKEYII